MYKRTIFLFMAMLSTYSAPYVCGSLYAMTYHGSQIITNVKMENEDIHIRSIDRLGSVYMDWRLTTMIGEPVISSKGVVILPEQSSYHATFKGKAYTVPGEVIKEITAVSVTIKAHISQNELMDIDLGAMGDIYFGTGLLIPKLSQEDKKKYFSFNVSGSPEWEKLFHTTDMGLGRTGYLTKEQAKTRFMEGVEIIPLWSFAQVQFNLNPVRNWIEKRIKANTKNSKKNTMGKEDPINEKKSQGYSGEITGNENNTANKTMGHFKKEDPFKKFEKMELPGSSRELEPIDRDIRAFIHNRCGKYYTRVEEGKQGFHLTAEYIGETREEAKKREKEAKAYHKKRKERVRRAKQKAINELPRLQREWKEKRAAIKAECRDFIMKKYSLIWSVEALDELLNQNFTPIENFKAVYYIPYDG